MARLTGSKITGSSSGHWMNIGWMINVLQMPSRGVRFLVNADMLSELSLKAVCVSWATGAKQPGLHYSHLSGSTSMVLLDPLHWVSVTRGNDNLNVSFWPAVCTATTAWQRWGGGHWCVSVCVCVCVELVAMVSKTLCAIYCILHMGGC